MVWASSSAGGDDGKKKKKANNDDDDDDNNNNNNNKGEKKTTYERQRQRQYHIGGIGVEFPYQPYGTQLAFMGRVISTLDRAQRDGHCHALLESPTGTGKSLSLLCSALAWQLNYKSNPHPHPHPTMPMTDPLTHGGGFIPNDHVTHPSSNAGSDSSSSSSTGCSSGTEGNNRSQKKKAAPTIYYSSRTHTQISQVIREYRKTSYRVPMAVLASRRHYCTNAHVRGKDNMDEECKLLLKNREVGCLHFKNFHKVKSHPSLQKGGCHEVHDIEDLVKVGQVVKGCSYYAARSMADDAQLVFCPYNYIINPVIRGAMDVDIKGAILILDEAHNIEDIARDAGSVDVEEDILQKLQTELEQLCAVDSMIYQPLYEMIEGLISWIEQRKGALEKREFQHYFSCWTGDKALRELQEANILQQCFPILLDCATKAIKAATDTESDLPHLSGMAVTIMEGLFSSLTYFFSRNGCHVSDYQLALQRQVKRDRKNAPGEWTVSLSLWCINPAVVFRDIANLSLSVILTSGTLSPMNSFSSELGVQFGTCLDAPHVVDVRSQVMVSVVSTGPDNYPLNASYKSADGFEFQDALGKSLEEICKIVPAGSLVFFPSYKLMEKLCNRWRQTGQWSRLNARKSLFVEPRGGSQEDFECLLKDYYKSVRQGNTLVGRKKRSTKIDLEHMKTLESQERKGAAFLAVCRGKVSEGVDFSDDNARAVIIVGIPFPNINDIQVSLKKKYNDTYKTSKNLLSGDEWYCHQAFRALNQAAGRCIRHRFDYGAIILLDERYKKERNRIYISKWLRQTIQLHDSLDVALEELTSFFRDAKEKVSKSMVDLSLSTDANGEKSAPVNEHSKKQSKKSNHTGKNQDPSEKIGANSPNLKSIADAEVQASLQIDGKIDIDTEIIDLQCDSQKKSMDFHKGSRLFEAASPEEVDVSFVKETPGLHGNGLIASPRNFSKRGNTSSLFQAAIDLTDEASFYSVSLPDPNMATCQVKSSMAVTPKKEFGTNTYSLIAEVESSLNLSVNSHSQKRRKFISSPLATLTGKQSKTPRAESPALISFSRSSIASININQKIEFGSGSNNSEGSTKSDGTGLHQVENCDLSCVSSGLVEDKSLFVSCALCKSPLGLPENCKHVRCSLTSSSKIYLRSLATEVLKRDAENTSTSVSVLMTDTSSLDQRLCNGSLKQIPQQGVWCEEDGCVFSSIFCPFCSTPCCLGVRIMATDASNIQLLNKILLFVNRLEIQKSETSQTGDPKIKDLSPVPGSSMDRMAILNSIDRFSYSPQQISGGWRTTNSKLRLPKRQG